MRGAALALLCLAVGCGASSGDASKAAAPPPAAGPPANAAAPADDGDAADADGWAGRVSTAEAAISRALGGGAPERIAKEKEKKDAEALAEGDACTEACRALGSMRRATERLCGLTGEADARCKGARTRTTDARGRVTAACPTCKD